MLCCIVLVVVSGAVGRSKMRDPKLAKTIMDRLNLERAELSLLLLVNGGDLYELMMQNGEDIEEVVS